MKSRLLNPFVLLILCVQATADDPIVQEAKLLPDDDAAGDDFGFAVAIDGNNALIGAPGDDVNGTDIGLVFLVQRTGGVWGDNLAIAGGLEVGAEGGTDLDLDGGVAVMSQPQHSGTGLANAHSLFAFPGSFLLPSDGGADDEFGHSVAISGQYLVVGAHQHDHIGGNSGAAYVYMENAGVWTEQQELLSLDLSGGDRLGTSVAIDGDTAVVGAPFEDDGGSNAGAVYVFVRSGTTWTQQAKLASLDLLAGDRFGRSVGISGDTIAVGARFADAPGVDSGAAYVFTRSGTVWTQQTKLVASANGADDEFGRELSLDGDTLAVSGPFNDDAANNGGAVWVFTRSGTVWTEEARLSASDSGSGDRFGIAVDLDGDFLIAGANRDDDAGNNAGAAYIFERSGTLWTEVAKRIPGPDSKDDGLGRVVATSGDRCAASALGNDDFIGNGSAVITYERSGTTWVEDEQLHATDVTVGNFFGNALAMQGDTLMVGAPQDSDMGMAAGAVYVFEHDGTSWQQQAKLFANDAAASAEFGGDVDLEGDTALIGAVSADGAFNFGGAGYVFVRSGTTWTQQAKIFPPGSFSPGLSVADKVAFSGDTAALTSFSDSHFISPDFHPAAGSVYVFERSGTSWSFAAQLIASNVMGQDRFGTDVAIEGDTLLVSAAKSTSLSSQGSVYLFERSGTSWNEIAEILASDGVANDQFGARVAIDGPTAIVRASGADDVGSSSGAAYVFQKQGGAWTEKMKLLPSPGAASDFFGFDVAVSGETAIVGALGDDTEQLEAGAAYVYRVPLPAFDSFCSGDGGDQMGCTECPCTNNAPQGSPGGCLNGAMQSAELLPSGAPCVSNDTLRFEMTGGNPSTFAVLTSGAARAPANAVNPCFGLDSGIQSMLLDGLRCVVQSVQRHGSRPMDANGDIGVMTNGWGPPNGPPGGLIAQGGFGAGQTRHYQVIYREDAALQCMTGQNTSNGVTVTFAP